MADEAQVVLAQLLQQHGRELAQDPRRLRAMLADTLPGTADAKRLVAAAEEGIPDQLLAIGSDETGAARLQLIRRLEEERDMTTQAAAWTVDAWAAAMEVPLRQSDPVVTGPVPGTGPGPGTGGGAGDETIPQDRSRDDLPPPPQRPWWAAAVAGAVLLGVAVVALIFLLRPPDEGTGGESVTPTVSPTAEASVASEAPSEEPSAAPSSEAPTPTATASTDSFTAAERELLTWIPANIRDSCESVDLNDVGNPVAVVECNLARTNRLTYLRYDGPRTMRQQYDRYARGPQDGGNCPNDLPSEGTWNFTGGETQGRLACFRSEGTAWMVWTANRSSILAWASRTDGDSQALLDAWRSGGPGPLQDPQ